MKAILEFDLNDLDDREAHSRCVKSTDLALVICDIQSKLRKTIEWKIEQNPKMKPYDVLDETLQEIGQYLEDRGIIIDDLIS
jgi:hypothetical protein